MRSGGRKMTWPPPTITTRQSAATIHQRGRQLRFGIGVRSAYPPIGGRGRADGAGGGPQAGGGTAVGERVTGASHAAPGAAGDVPTGAADAGVGIGAGAAV